MRFRSHTDYGLSVRMTAGGWRVGSACGEGVGWLNFNAELSLAETEIPGGEGRGRL